MATGKIFIGAITGGDLVWLLRRPVRPQFLVLAGYFSGKHVQAFSDRIPADGFNLFEGRPAVYFGM